MHINPQADLTNPKGGYMGCKDTLENPNQYKCKLK
jgi:hypothetical protein